MSLVLNQVEWLRDQKQTALSAVDRVGTSWTRVVIAVQRDGWQRLQLMGEVRTSARGFDDNDAIKNFGKTQR